MYNIPSQPDLIKQCHIPIALSISPFARLHPEEVPPPLIDLGEFTWKDRYGQTERVLTNRSVHRDDALKASLGPILLTDGQER